MLINKQHIQVYYRKGAIVTVLLIPLKRGFPLYVIFGTRGNKGTVHCTTCNKQFRHMRTVPPVLT